MNSLNFTQVEPAKSQSSGSKYFGVGKYEVKVDPDNVLYVTQDVKTPYISVLFQSVKEDDPRAIEAKFYTSPGALPRLQYAHYAITGSTIDKEITNVEKYFKRMFSHRTYGLTIGKSVNPDTGKAYSEVPYTDFIDVDFTGEITYEEDSPEYKKLIRVQKSNPNAVPNATLTQALKPEKPAKVEDEEDDLPF